MGAHLSGGVALKWLMNQMLEMKSYDDMTALAGTVPAGSEGLVFGLRSSLEIFKGLGISYQKIIASGGGARSRLFLQMQADILNGPIFTNENNEQACVGAAITAAVAAGEYRSCEEACNRLVKLSETTVEPDRENQKYYEEQFAIYRELYGHNQDLFHKNVRG